jgi:predicted nucleic acid-binding protein
MTDGERLIDTNVLVHAYVLLAPKKQPSARDIVMPIWQRGGGLTTVQNLCEFFFVVTRKVKQPMRPDLAGGIVRQFFRSPSWRVLDRDEETIARAVELVKQHHVPFWDALIAACMLENGIHTIVTEFAQPVKR